MFITKINTINKLTSRFINHQHKTMKKTSIFPAMLWLCMALFTGMNVYSMPGHEQALTPSQKVDELIREYDNAETPGGAILVMRDGEIIYRRGFGMANLSHGVPFQPGTPTNIGSTSKQFTSFAIGLLEEEGLLSLDDDIRDHIPELPDLGDTVRIWHLISHTSGYREYLNSIVMSGRMLGDYVSYDEIIPLIQRQPKLQNTPGGSYNYNNTGYFLMAEVIQRLTGQSYPEWMEENVFLPVGMKNTLVLENAGKVITGSAQGYQKSDDDTFLKTSDLSASMGPGGIYSTVEDLALWVRHFHEPKVGSKALIEKMQTPFVKNDGDTLNYAMGLIIDKLNGLKRVEHGGADISHRSAFYMFPEVKGAVIVQSNNSGIPGNISNKVAEAFFADVMEIETKEVADSEDFIYDVEKFDEIAGRYEMVDMPGFIMEFFREDDKLYTQATGQGRVELFASSDSTFYLTIVEASMTFHRNEAGEVDAMTLHQSGNHRAKRIFEPKWIPSQEDLDMYLGRYFSEELEAFYEVALDDEDNLVLRHRRFNDIPLKAEEKDVYTGSFPMTGVRFVRDDSGMVTGFRASSGRSFGIVFEKLPQ